MAKDDKARGKAYDGDHTDPRKSKAVDASYDKGYLDRRNKFVEEMRAKKGKRGGGEA
jgi:hypothetical protein